MTARKLAVAALSAGVAVTLAACGTQSASHVVPRSTPPTTAAPSTTVAGGGAGAGPATSATVTASDVLSQQTLNQVAAELGSLDSSFSTANSDLNNPQGDS